MHDEDNLITNVGARLKQLRYAAGYTQEVMANRVGSGLRNYQRLETGTINMSLRTLARLATALDLDPKDLLFPLPQPRRSTLKAPQVKTAAARTVHKTSKTKASKTVKAPKSTRSSKTAKTSRTAKPAKTSKAGKGTQVSKSRSR